MLAEADYDTTQLADPRATSGDDRLGVHFYMGALQNTTKSDLEGRPIFDDVEFIRIVVPGDKDNIVDRPLWPSDKRRFPRQYAAFKNNQEQSISGTPISAVPWISKAQCEELTFFGVRSIEQLATVADDLAQKFMGVNKMKQLAARFLEAAKEAAPLTKMQAELESRDNKIAAQDQAIAELQKSIDVLLKAQAKDK